MKNSKLQNMTQVALCAAILCIVSPFAIPIGQVPLSLATLIVMICAVVFGKKSVYAVLIYLCIGAIGLPVFSNFRGGLSTLVGPTGGFLIGYVFLAYAISFSYENIYNRLFWIIIGNVLLYMFGTMWFSIITQSTIWVSLITCVFPFLLTDMIKIGIVIVIEPMILRRLSYVL